MANSHTLGTGYSPRMCLAHCQPSSLQRSSSETTAPAARTFVWSCRGLLHSGAMRAISVHGCPTTLWLRKNGFLRNGSCLGKP